MKNNKLDWNEEHTKSFHQIKNAIIQIIENKLFDTNRTTRVRCDASKEGLGARLEQKYDNGWHPIAYASRFLINNEQKYSINELELLSVVWSLKHLKYNLYGSRLTLQTDHQALLSALKDNRGKTYQSRLTRWVDRLLPFNFSAEHTAGKNMGITDYFSRHLTLPAIPVSKDEKIFVINLIDSFKFMLKRADKIHPIESQQIYQLKMTQYRQVNENKQSKPLLASFVAQNSRSLLIHFC